MRPAGGRGFLFENNQASLTGLPPTRRFFFKLEINELIKFFKMKSNNQTLCVDAMIFNDELASILQRLEPAERAIIEAALARAADAPPAAKWQIRQARLDDRDDALRSLASRHYEGESTNAAASLIEIDLVHLANVKIDATTPRDLASKRDNLIHVFILCGGKIPSPGHLRRILSGARTPDN